MLLSKNSIAKNIKNVESPILSGIDEGDQIESSSVDLTIESIFLPSTEKELKRNIDIQTVGKNKHSIKAGETAIIQVAQEFDMPKNIGGIVFPPNRLSKYGLLMTNPGHIDPGFKGKITVCLINMGGEKRTLQKGEKILTLLLFEVDNTTPGFLLDEPSPGVDREQLINLTKDFADLTRRMRREVYNTILTYSGGALAILSIFVVVILALVPMISGYIAAPNLEKITEYKIHKEFIIPLSNNVSSLKFELKDQQKNQDARISILDKTVKKQINEINGLRQQIEELSKKTSSLNMGIDVKKSQ